MKKEMDLRLGQDVESPLVTVIMKCYNHEKYVQHAIESVLAQTYTNMECIFIDNGSTDNSRQIILEYADRAKIFCLDENDQEKAAELFIQNTIGDYVAYMTSDDIWLPDKLEKQMEYLINNPECDGCFTLCEYCHGDNLELTHDNLTNLFVAENRTSSEWLNYFWKNANCLCAPSSVIKRESYYKLFDNVISYWQLCDFWQWILFLLNGNTFHVLPQKLVLMRAHDQSISFSENSVDRCLVENMSIRMEILNRLTDNQFVEVFYDDMVNQKAANPDEIICEKILLLFRWADVYQELQPLAVDYFYRNYSKGEVKNIFQNVYGLKREYFNEILNGVGTRKLMREYYEKGVNDMNDYIKQQQEKSKG